MIVGAPQSARDSRRRLVVSAAVLERDGAVLVTRRLPGTHLEGCWEFPGGKCEAGETLEGALVRELREELGIEIEVGAEVLRTRHSYADRDIEICFFRVTHRSGALTGRLGQELRWLPAGDLDASEFPPADRDLIALLRRPD